MCVETDPDLHRRNNSMGLGRRRNEEVERRQHQERDQQHDRNRLHPPSEHQ
jgi:hypothetical protein